MRHMKADLACLHLAQLYVNFVQENPQLCQCSPLTLYMCSSETGWKFYQKKQTLDSPFYTYSCAAVVVLIFT